MGSYAHVSGTLVFRCIPKAAIIVTDVLMRRQGIYYFFIYRTDNFEIRLKLFKDFEYILLYANQFHTYSLFSYKNCQHTP